MGFERISDQLRYMTIRILVSQENEFNDSGEINWTGSGTGFLYMLEAHGEVPVLITNKHVLAGARLIGLTFHAATGDKEKPVPEQGPGRLIAISSDHAAIFEHPDPDVDLAAIPLMPIVEHVVRMGWHPYIKCLCAKQLPNNSIKEGLGSIEEIFMVGYPNGLSDTANNFPIVRRGITSTPFCSDYLGRKEFLADVPVYGGSSGSPIFVVNEGTWAAGTGLMEGTRFSLLGVLYAGHTQTVNGRIVAEPVPTNFVSVAKIESMINLGICIRSELIEDLAALIPPEV